MVAAYNIADYIGDCLTSLLATDDPRCEVIVVNDGSTDETPAILASFEAEHPMLRVLDRINGGLGAARNSGIEAARGDYVTFVDGDDWVQSDYVGTCLTHLVDDPSADLWVFDYIDVTDSGRFVQRCMPNFWECKNAAWNKIYRRDLIGSDRFDEDILYEDLAAVRPWVARCQRPRRIDTALYNYRNMRTGSIMSSVDTTRFFELLTAAERCVSRIEAFGSARQLESCMGADWRKRFYTADVFMPAIVDWPRKIDSAAERRLFSAEFMARLPEGDIPDKRILATTYGIKIAVATLCYERGAFGTGDLLLHRLGRIKRRLLGGAGGQS